MYYEVGDSVSFTAPNGSFISGAIVTARVDRLWDGRPGFIGTVADERVWGLDDEITDVAPHPHRRIYSASRVTELARKVCDALTVDMREGVIPSTVEKWSDLHDFVDANTYVLDVMPEWSASDECNAFTVAVEDEAFRMFKGLPTNAETKEA